MSGLDIFALVVLIVLIVAGLGLWAMLGMYPGKIAKARNHPQADAIAVCGWWGAITLGILTPIAYIWAYSKTPSMLAAEAAAGDAVTDSEEGERA